MHMSIAFPYFNFNKERVDWFDSCDLMLSAEKKSLRHLSMDIVPQPIVRHYDVGFRGLVDTEENAQNFLWIVIISALQKTIYLEDVARYFRR